MKIKVFKELEDELDIEFPIYTKHDDVSDQHTYIVYRKINQQGSNLTLSAVTVTDTSEELEFLPNYTFPKVMKPSELDYYLGRNQYKSSELEFNTALIKAKQLLLLLEN